MESLRELELNEARALYLPGPVDRLAKASLDALIRDGRGAASDDFLSPEGEEAFASPHSVSWRIFKNPVALLVGGVTAVILELAEPRVRTGVWTYSGFRADPARRLRRTGLAAMMTVYGAKSRASSMIANVRRMHERVQGETPDGASYHANDPELLNWVYATASFGFLNAYHTYVCELSRADRDRYFAEAGPASRLYGASATPKSESECEALFQAMIPCLEASPIIFEFLEIMRSAPVMPAAVRPFQPLLIEAAVELVPPKIRRVLGLERKKPWRSWRRILVSRAGAISDRIVLTSAPPAQACRRLGLPADYLYTRQHRSASE